MTDTSQKLREALQRYGKHDRDCGVNNTRFNCACNCGLEAALVLPTAGKMINGLTQSETDASASVSGLTAAPVSEREAFEQWWKGDLVDWRGHAAVPALHAWAAWQAGRAALRETLP